MSERLRDIVSADASRADDVFMKVGASGTVSPHLLRCFAEGGSYQLDWDGREAALLPTVDGFLLGDAAGDDPFERVTLAALSGRSAAWAISGNPSPLDEEIAAINPRFAYVNYGTNDMQLGTTHRSALFPFFENLSQLLDQLEQGGIVPIVSGLNPRSDSAGAADWVPTYDAVTRGMSEARQLPYISLFEAARDLPAMGLVGDGVHGNVYASGGSQPCVFTDAALEFNYNIRNLLSVEVLDALRHTVLLGEPAPDDPGSPVAGQGTVGDPWRIDGLPFTHAADTSLSTTADFASYAVCDSGQDEAGPEWIYQLTLTAQTALRIIVLDRGSVDIDLHLLGASADPSTCLQRHDRIVELTLDAGVYHLALDSFVPGDGVPRSGPYLLVVLACEAGDPDCL